MRRILSSQFYWVVLVICLSTICGCESKLKVEKAIPTSDSAGEKISVTTTIDFQGVAQNQTFECIHNVDSTVLGVLQDLVSEGRLEFDFIGNGRSAFVTSIGGIENQAKRGSNWVYFLNGKLANEGAGACFVKDGDKIAWKFTTQYLE